MVCPLLSVAIVLLTLSSEQIVDGSINLDPDYQRGMSPVVLSVRPCNFVSLPRRGCLVRTKADRSRRLSLSQLLHSSNHLWSVCRFPSLSQLAQILSKAVTTTDDGSETRVCIDGKQRLTSIQK
jgi:hypothetical protein